MSNTNELKNMLESIISGNDDQARVTFHTYLSGKMKVAIAEAKKGDIDKAEKIEDEAQKDVKDIKKKAGNADEKLNKAKKLEEAKAERGKAAFRKAVADGNKKRGKFGK